MGKAEIDMRIRLVEAMIEKYISLSKGQNIDSKYLEKRILELSNQLSRLYQEREELD